MIEIYVRPSNSQWDPKWVADNCMIAWVIDTENATRTYGVRMNRTMITHHETFPNGDRYPVEMLSKIREQIINRLGTEWVHLTVRSRWIGYVNPVSLVKWKKQLQNLK